MDGNKTIGPLALRRIGEAFRRMRGVPRKLPFRLYELVAQLRRATKGDDYRHNAAELMRLAEHAQSPAEKTHLVTLAEGWVELAEKAHKNKSRPQEPTILHPLVEKKIGKHKNYRDHGTRACPSLRLSGTLEPKSSGRPLAEMVGRPCGPIAAVALADQGEPMSVQIVMDLAGDTRHHFDQDDATAVAEAEKRFRELIGAGFIAAKRTGTGTSELIRHFDPTAQETVFIPRLVGG